MVSGEVLEMWRPFECALRRSVSIFESLCDACAGEQEEE